MKKGLRITTYVACGVAMIAFSQCNRNKTTDNFDQSPDVIKAEDTSAEDDFNKSKTIFYTLPSPAEMASIIKESGVKFDVDLLNSILQSDRYDSNLKMSLNLGIYSTDMSIASIFNQSQKTVDYLNALKKLTDRLGIVQLVNEDIIRKMEENKSSREEIMGITSEVFMNAHQYLNENNRKNVAVMVLIGGWVEGLHLALNMIDTSRPNASLAERIIAQKMALTTVMNILETNNVDGTDEDLNYLKAKMEEIKMIFDEVHVETSGRVVATTDKETRTTSIKANTKNEVSTEILSLLKEKVSEIRTEFVE